MSKRTPEPDGVARPQAPYSPVVVDGDLVYTAGQVAFDEQGELVPGGIEEQTRRALENLTACRPALPRRAPPVLPGLRLLVTGGIEPGGGRPWLDAGALAVGLGTNLGAAATVGAVEVESRCRAARAAAS
jgi:hypothetical protein